MTGASVRDHEGFTKMLFVDGVVGLGTSMLYKSARGQRTRDGTHTNPLVTTTFDSGGPLYAWNRFALEELPVSDLQDLYTGLKYQEVTHAS